jgi:hypothetical protein
MIETSKLNGVDFHENFEALEDQFVDEIENIISSQLFEKGCINSEKNENGEVEFFGRTNFKIRLKQPNKNVWSVPIQLLKRSIKKVLRNGGNLESLTVPEKKSARSGYEVPIGMLLKSIPDDEFKKRTFVGNTIDHSVYGEGVIKGINDTGNIEVEFKDREILLKPEFCKLKIG